MEKDKRLSFLEQVIKNTEKQDGPSILSLRCEEDSEERHYRNLLREEFGVNREEFREFKKILRRKKRER